MAKIGLHQLSQVCHRLGTSLRAGVALREILAQEMSHGSARHRDKMTHVSEWVARGETLAASMSRTRGYFPPFVCEMVDVGEQTGQLESVLLHLSENYRHALSLRRQFFIGIAWPVIELTLAVVIVGLVIWLLGVLPGKPVTIFFGLSGTSGLLWYSLGIFVIASVLAFIIIAVWRGWFGSLPLRLAWQVPGLGKCLRTMALARFAWSLSMSLGSGLDALRAVRLSLNSTQNASFMSHTEDVVDRIRNQGLTFHEALGASQIFPEEFLQSLAAAELAGSESESLERLAKDYEERARGALAVLTRLASVAVWILIALIILYFIAKMVMYIIQPYQEAFEMLEQGI